MASQVAVFKRMEDSGLSEMRERKCEGLAILARMGTEKAHQLLGSYTHDVDPRVRQAGTLEEIGQLVLQRMETYKEGSITIHNLWSENDITLLCGGWLQKLVAAVKTTAGLSLEKPGGKGASDWVVRREGFVPEPTVYETGMSDVQNHETSTVISPWADTTVTETGWGAESVFGANESVGWSDETWSTSEGDNWASWDIESSPETIASVA